MARKHSMLLLTVDTGKKDETLNRSNKETLVLLLNLSHGPGLYEIKCAALYANRQDTQKNNYIHLETPDCEHKL